MANEARNLRILLTDGREFSIRASSAKYWNSTQYGPAYKFEMEGGEACVVTHGKLTAVNDERALQGDVFHPGVIETRETPALPGNGRKQRDA